MNVFLPASLGILLLTSTASVGEIGLWMKQEVVFTSDTNYQNPLYDLSSLVVTYTSPSGRVKRVNAFWDGGTTFRTRFCPDELGGWTWRTECSDTDNKGLHGVTGSFTCVKQASPFDIYTKGGLVRPRGSYHLTHADGTPFFWTACTAWNGALKSTDAEWTKYLQQRADTGYNVIQFVTSQWRGCDVDSQGEVAFTGVDRIAINPAFFQRLDAKVDAINAHGLVAAPVLLWALPSGQGRELSPGYALPEREAILLAKYTVARYGGHQVVWFLGGDGKYIDEYEQRWKNIGRGVFGGEHPGLVAQHPQGRSWIGSAYANESWLDIVGYQSSHSNAQATVDWINKGPMAAEWDKLPARPLMNLEPNYEQIRKLITAQDVRNASYWSLLATPISGITYGANGIWPWIRPGEEILNHGDGAGVTPWYECIELDGSHQIGYLANFVRSLEWWRYRPCPELLIEQPGDAQYNHFIAVAKTDNHDSFLAYLPVKSTVRLRNPLDLRYAGEWFNPITNERSTAVVEHRGHVISATSPTEQDFVLLLRRTKN